MSLYQVDALRRVGERLRRSDRLRAEGCGPESAPPSPGGGARRGPAALAWGRRGPAPRALARCAFGFRAFRGMAALGAFGPLFTLSPPPHAGGLRSPRRPVAAAAVPPAAPAPLPAPSGAGAAGFVPRPPHSRGRRRLRVPPCLPPCSVAVVRRLINPPAHKKRAGAARPLPRNMNKTCLFCSGMCWFSKPPLSRSSYRITASASRMFFTGISCRPLFCILLDMLVGITTFLNPRRWISESR